MENITWIQRRGQIKHLLYELCLTGRIDRATLAEQFKDLNSAEPVKHGRWIRKTEQLKDCTVYWYVCSECGERPLHGRLRADDALTNYCPNCGAKMDEVEE